MRMRNHASTFFLLRTLVTRCAFGCLLRYFFVTFLFVLFFLRNPCLATFCLSLSVLRPYTWRYNMAEKTGREVLEESVNGQISRDQ